MTAHTLHPTRISERMLMINAPFFSFFKSNGWPTLTADMRVNCVRCALLATSNLLRSICSSSTGNANRAGSRHPDHDSQSRHGAAVITDHEHIAVWSRVNDVAVDAHYARHARPPAMPRQRAARTRYAQSPPVLLLLRPWLLRRPPPTAAAEDRPPPRPQLLVPMLSSATHTTAT